jgi:hypothetical protein
MAKMDFTKRKKSEGFKKIHFDYLCDKMYTKKELEFSKTSRTAITLIQNKIKMKAFCEMKYTF